MKILLVFHGWFPDVARPVSGGGLRAWHHAESLRGAGHEVVVLTRDQDRTPGGPATFSTGASLRALAAEIAPDAIVCVQPEEAPHLGDLGIPLVVDFYAPRLLEALFEDRLGEEGVRTLRALGAADLALFSNPRQRYFYLGLLLLAGVDVRGGMDRVVPLVAPTAGRTGKVKKTPIFVMGGLSWPWHDPVEGIRRAAAHLERRGQGEIHLYGGAPVVGGTAVRALSDGVPASDRVRHEGLLPYPDLLRVYARATAALDYMAPSPERELAVSFRAMDYLGSGLPILTTRDHLVGDWVALAGAGIVDLPVEDAIDAVLDAPTVHRERRVAARTLAARFSRETCEAPLLAWLGSARVRPKHDAPLGDLARAWARVTTAEAAREGLTARLQEVREEAVRKRAEVEDLLVQVRQLTDTVHRLTGAMSEVAGFRREAIAVLGSAEHLAREEASNLAKEIAIVRADNAKKTAELKAMEDEQRRLENDLVHAREEIERLRKRRFLVG